MPPALSLSTAVRPAHTASSQPALFVRRRSLRCFVLNPLPSSPSSRPADWLQAKQDRPVTPDGAKLSLETEEFRRADRTHCHTKLDAGTGPNRPRIVAIGLRFDARGRMAGHQIDVIKGTPRLPALDIVRHNSSSAAHGHRPRARVFRRPGWRPDGRDLLHTLGDTLLRARVCLSRRNLSIPLRAEAGPPGARKRKARARSRGTW